MSREKECKCCHEWWYASVIKEDLCPNCYDYFKQLKQQLAEKDKENEELKLKLDIRAMNLQNINTERMEAVRNQKQLAIQELEKVKDYIQKHKYKTLKEDRHIVYYKSLKDQIDNQIKELKGDNDEPRQSN